MDQKSSNQQRTRKDVGDDSAFRNNDQPSKAPQQDEGGAELVGSAGPRPHQVDPNSDKQGISNRPVSEEHAFPESGVEDAGTSDSVDIQPKQQGGNRGGV